MKKKRWLGILLTAIMVLTMAPTVAFAAVDENDVARIGDTGYDTLQEAVAAIENDGSGEIVLLKSLTGNSKINVNNGKDITIDLNGNDIGFAADQNFTVMGGKLSLTGEGKVYEEAPYYSPVMIKGSAEDIADFSVVNVGDNVTLEGWAGLFIDQNSKADYGIVANVYGTLNSVKDTNEAGGHALYINGSISITEGNVPKITLEGATLNTEKGNGMYLAGYAETYVKDSTITSKAENGTGIEIRAGKLEIVDSTISGGMGETDIAPNGNGSTTNNVALAVVQHTTKLPTEVTVINSKLAGGAALFEQNAQKNDLAAIEKVKIDVQSGTFTGEIYSENKSGFIKSGNFSEPVDDKYIVQDGISIKYESGQTTTYYIGSEDQLNEIVENVVPGDKIEVLKGSIALDVPVEEVTITNNGNGEVTVNGVSVANNASVVTEKQETPEVQQPTQPPTDVNKDNADKTPETGDDSNMTIPFVAAGLALAVMAAVVATRKRHG